MVTLNITFSAVIWGPLNRMTSIFVIAYNLDLDQLENEATP